MALATFNTTEPPTQNEVGPAALITDVTDVAFTLTVTSLPCLVQPLAVNLMRYFPVVVAV